MTFGGFYMQSKAPINDSVQKWKEKMCVSRGVLNSGTRDRWSTVTSLNGTEMQGDQLAAEFGRFCSKW